MRTLSFKTLILSSLLLSLSFAQTPNFELNQQWNLYFQDANGWVISLDTQTSDGFKASAKSSSFGETLETSLAELDAEDKAFLGLSDEPQFAFLISYPTGVANANGASLILCSFAENNLEQGKAFGLRQESNGVRIVSQGQACSAQLITEIATSNWPPSLQAGETWQLSIMQNQAELANWTITFEAQDKQELAGSAIGTDARQVEAVFFSANAPQPNMLNSWVFALGNENATPLYCIFPQDKPFSADSMTGSAVFTGASCVATKL